MPIFNHDRIEELMLIISDRVEAMNKRWWYALGIVVIASIPLFFIFKYSFFSALISTYQPPVVITNRPQPEPLQVLDRKIFELGSNNYAAFVRIKNINLERGVPELSYEAKFKTAGGTVAAAVTGKTFVLPASEKVLSFAKFASDKKPELVEFTFLDPKFVYRPDLPNINLDVERVQLERQSNEFSVSASVRNLSAFTVKQIYLPVLVYDNGNNIVGVSSTVVNHVKSSEVRTFRFVWPLDLSRAVRAEINPEVNIFEKGILTTETGDVQLFEAPGSR